MQRIYAESLPRRLSFFPNTQDFAFAPLEKMSTKKKVSVSLAGFRPVSTLQWRVGLKSSLKITLKCLQGIIWFKDFETILAFLSN